ncbi:MAG: hypothetical protein Q4E18_00900 [Clostridia bacterium]|nr:hypothetical protein [Clostridia bacterium]
MKTYEIKMSRSRWFSLLLAVLMIVMIVELCTPYFTYGKQTLSFVPPEGGNEKILNGTWKLSGSDETQDGYKEIVINSGKMTVKTTNIIRVNQIDADKAVETAKADYEKIAANVKAADIAVQKAEALEAEGKKVFDMIAKKLGSNETADALEKEEEQAEAAAANATAENAEPAAEEKPAEEKSKQLTDAETSLKKMVKAVNDAKDNLAKAQEALVIAQEAVTAAREGAVKTYEADASYAWITETEEAYNNAVDEAFKADYISGNTDRVRSELIAAAESKELEALKKTRKAELKAEGITDSKAVDKALNEVAVSAEKKNEIAASITDDAVAAEVEKQYADYIANMLGEKKDGALNDKLNANKALAAEGAKAAIEAMNNAEAAAKEGEKTYQKKAEKAASDSEKELAKLQKTALELLPETVFEELANDYQAAEVAALQYEAYDNTSSEKAMMETEGKAKYNEKKSTLSLTFANGQKIDTNFGASFGYNEIKHLSILGYVGFPYEVEDFSEEMTYRIENFYINDVVLIPIILLVLCIIGIVMCALKKDKLSAGIVPAILGVVGVIGYLTSDFLKLGDKYTVHIILFAVIFAVAVLHIVLSAKKAKKA